MELAAVATAAVPGLSPTAVSPAPDDAADFDSALLLDSEGKRWKVRSPRHPEASARLETEFLVLRAFAPAIRAELPFLMPTVAGKVRLGALSTFVYSHLNGTTRTVEDLTSGQVSLAREVGSTLAAIHDLPQALVNSADLPSYTPNEFRQRRLNELDQAATTGKIPGLLLRRWEHALEDVSLWRFNPSVVHGDLHEDNLLIDNDRVTAVTGWTDLRIGDPADDFAWLVASNEQDFVETVLKSYTDTRRDVPDPHLLRRAALSAEFALAQYLVKAVSAADSAMIAEAEDMLKTLADDIAEHGGQAISIDEVPAPAVAAGTSVGRPAASVPPVLVTPIPAAEIPPAPVTPAPAAEAPPAPVTPLPAAEAPPAPATPAPAAEAPPAPATPAPAAEAPPVQVAPVPADDATEPGKPAPEDTSTGATSTVSGGASETP